MKKMLILSTLLFSAKSMALTCYVTIAKDSCWTNYNVSVNVLSASSDQVVANVSIPKGQVWSRTSFNCDAQQNYFLQAQYSPSIWQGTDGQKYNAQNYWQLSQINANTKAQSLSLCYGKDFSEVPMPPSASGKCSCDMGSIPAVKISN